jgi:hypothetical protein
MKFLISESQKKKLIEYYRIGLNEQTRIEGPFKNPNSTTGDLYVMKNEKNMCRNDNADLTRYTIYPMTGSTCDQGYTLIPGGKYYVQFFHSVKNNIYMFTPEYKEYFVATNNGQGYATPQEAKKAISQILNPAGNVGRNVTNIKSKDQYGKDQTYKMVSKYDKQGNLKKIKVKGDGYREVIKTGL